MSILIKRLKHLTFKIDVDNVDDVDAFFDEYLYSVYIIKKMIKIYDLYKAKKIPSTMSTMSTIIEKRLVYAVLYVDNFKTQCPQRQLKRL